ncbi:MAG TPA: TIGR02147 family protein [Polyangiales bacterium]
MNQGERRKRGPVDVFRYLDYRRFLADVYSSQKRRGLSYRAFARRAQLGAPNYLKLVIDGERNLTPEMAQRFADAVGLGPEAAAYFCELVAFCQAVGSGQKARHHRRLLSFRRYREAHKLEGAHAEYHSAWYLPAIRELVVRPDFQDDPRWIAARLVPPIKPSEAKQALATLVRLGLIEREDSGRVRQTSAVVTTGPETQGVHIATYHAEMAQRAIASIDLVPAASRDISSLTMCVGEGGLSRLKQRVQAFRRELLELAESESERRQVVQLNFQLFPLSSAEEPTAEAQTTRRTRRSKEDEHA